jgi:hypothetical protein
VYAHFDELPREVASVRATRELNRMRGVVVETAINLPKTPYPPGRWAFLFEARGAGDIAPGDYPNARGMGASQDFPVLQFDTPHGEGYRYPEEYDWVSPHTAGNSGHFVVWEIEIKDDRVARLAIDFTGRCEWTEVEKKVKLFYGMIRYNSTFR